MDTDFRGGPLSDANLRRASSDLGAHIQSGGSPNDRIGFELVARFVRQLARYSDFVIFARTHDICVEEVCGIVRIAILFGQRGVLPALFVRDVTGNILVGCVLVQKSSALREIAYFLSQPPEDKYDPRFANDEELFFATAFSPKTVQLALAVEKVGTENVKFIHSKNPKSTAELRPDGGMKSLPDEHSRSGCLALLLLAFFSCIAIWISQT
jgi:hypothetical protein